VLVTLWKIATEMKLTKTLFHIKQDIINPEENGGEEKEELV
jgi:hypothetical protein